VLEQGLRGQRRLKVLLLLKIAGFYVCGCGLDDSFSCEGNSQNDFSGSCLLFQAIMNGLF
jgi:hypothetical protein